MGVHLYTNGAWTDSGRIYRNSLNLFDEDYSGISNNITYKSIYVGDGDFILSTTCPSVDNATALFFLAGDVQSGASSSNNGVYTDRPISVSAINGYVTIAYRTISYASGIADPRNEQTMLNKGSISIPYEPYNIVDWYANTGHGYSSGAWD